MVHNDYDVLPYRSMPFAQTQPSHLAATAMLFGMEPPPVAGSRVLELGCAAGGNIIPLAVRFPNAQFSGVDLSARHVEDGQRTIRQLGLNNIQITQGDLAAIDLAGQQFDYIICHGVFSWVPRSVQDAIFRICSENLVSNGVAYISYNVLPGWHLRKIVRDLCTHHAGKEGAPQHRVARARWMLNQVAKLSSDTTNFGRILRDEAKLTAPLPDSYILGEFLADENSPCYFHEFVDRAADHGLTFLCEANLAASIPESYGAEQAKLIRAIAGSSGAVLEQYIDFFTGRPFRRSLLIKSGQASTIQRTLSPERLRPLHFSSQLRLDPVASEGANAVFTHQQRSMSTNDPVLRRVMERLASAYPGTCTLDDLVGAIEDYNLPDPPQSKAIAEARLSEALFKAVASADITISSTPLQVGRAMSGFPAVFKLARLQAAGGQDWANSLQHRAVALHPAMRVLLPFLDGTQDRNMLRERLDEALRTRQISIEQLNKDSEHIDPVRLKAVAETMLEQMLRYLEENALLVPG